MRAVTLQMGPHINSLEWIDALLKRSGFIRDWYGGGPPLEPTSIVHAAHGSRRGARRLVLYTRDGAREVHQVTVDLHTTTWRVAADCQEVGRGVGYTHLVKQLRRLGRRSGEAPMPKIGKSRVDARPQQPDVMSAEAVAADARARIARQKRNAARNDWVDWLHNYGAGKFYEAFLRTAQGAQGHCVRCRRTVYLDIAEGGGVPDWRTEDGDYGCEEGGSHEPRKLPERQQ